VEIIKMKSVFLRIELRPGSVGESGGDSAEGAVSTLEATFQGKV